MYKRQANYSASSVSFVVRTLNLHLNISLQTVLNFLHSAGWKYVAALKAITHYKATDLVKKSSP